MMKQILAILVAAVVGTVFYSCAEQTYAKQLKEEEKLIKEYIRREGISIIKEFPAADAWKPNEYLEVGNGMYFHLEKAGDAGDSIRAGNLAIVRFKSYTLGNPADSLLNWTTIDFGNAPQFVWGTTDRVCEAWLVALALMQRQNSEGKIIAPSKTGFNSQTASASWGVFDDESSVTPRLYHLKLIFQK